MEIIYAMIKYLLFIPLLFFLADDSNVDRNVPDKGNKPKEVPANAYTFGEELTFKVKYSLYLKINVGEVKFKVSDEAKRINNRHCYHITGHGRTYRFYDPFFKIRDRFDSYIHTETLQPQLFIRIIREGSYSKDEHVIFNHEKGLAKSEKKVSRIPSNTQDILSSLYLARSFDYDRAVIGDSFMVHTYVDDSVFFIGVKYMGKEEIKTSAGKFRCIRLKPILIVDRIFDSEDEMEMWVTDDRNRIPVRVESGISVGSIVAELDSFKKLKYPLTSKID